MKNSRNNKAFTLVELIVVIAIIGILAAVLIPTISGFIDKARLSNDRTDARNMTTILQSYLIENDGVDPALLEAPDIVSIINMTDKNYNLVPRNKKYSFWYDLTRRVIEVLTDTEALHLDYGLVVEAAGELGSSIEEIYPGMIYLNTTGELASALYAIRNLNNAANFDVVKASFNLDSLATYNLTSHIEQFNPTKTLYINANQGFTTAVGGSLSIDYDPITGAPIVQPETYKKVEKIVFATGIKSIPDLSTLGPLEIKKEDSSLPIVLPVTVKSLEAGSFANIVSASKIMASNINHLFVVEGALPSFSNLTYKDMTNVNSILVTKSTNANVMSSLKAKSYKDVGIYITGRSEDETNPTGKKYWDYNPISGTSTSMSDVLISNLIVLAPGETIKLDLSQVTGKKAIDYSSTVNKKSDGTGFKVVTEDHVRIFNDHELIAYFIIQYIK